MGFENVRENEKGQRKIKGFHDIFRDGWHIHARLGQQTTPKDNNDIR